MGSNSATSSKVSKETCENAGQDTMPPLPTISPSRFRKHSVCAVSTVSQSVTEYSIVFHCLASRINLEESEEHLAAHFVSGLQKKILYKMTVNPQYSFMNAINLAECLEQQSTCYTHFGRKGCIKVGYSGLDL